MNIIKKLFSLCLIAPIVLHNPPRRAVLTHFVKSFQKIFVFVLYCKSLHYIEYKDSSTICGTKYSRIDQVKFFKGCLPQFVLEPFLNTLSHVFTQQAFTSPKLTIERGVKYIQSLQ